MNMFDTTKQLNVEYRFVSKNENSVVSTNKSVPDFNWFSQIFSNIQKYYFIIRWNHFNKFTNWWSFINISFHDFSLMST
jgi:hypothetical protein